MPRVLLIDDDKRLHELLTTYLEQNGFSVMGPPDGRRGLSALDAEPFDIVLLHVMMPGMDGLEVCRRIRAKSRVPILMLTAKGDETDRVVGLELGADDYIAKPFGPRELVARLRAVLRRANPPPETDVVIVNDIAIDGPGHKVKMRGQDVDLTGIEFDILLALAKRSRRVVGRDALLSEPSRADVTVGDRTVDVHISHLRQKLVDDPRSPKKIKTIRGVSYVLLKDGT